jgi:Asp-tRNA(Asn)/Glu-tRNA(Gln) amidotransferase A subunit family amidase
VCWWRGKTGRRVNSANASETDDPEIYDGAHVSLQIVGKKLQEEKMLAIAAYVESLLGASQ